MKKICNKMRKGAYLFTGNHEEFPLDEISEIKVYDKGLNIFIKTCNAGKHLSGREIIFF